MRTNPCTMAELPPHKLTFKDFLDLHLCPSLFFDLHLAAMIILLKFIILSNRGFTLLYIFTEWLFVSR